MNLTSVELIYLITACILLGTYLASKADRDVHVPTQEEALRSLLCKAQYGCDVVTLCDTDSEKRRLAKKDNTLIFHELNHLNSGYSLISAVSPGRILQLAQVWDGATEEQKAKVRKWGEMVT